MSSTDELRRLAQESRLRLAALAQLREQQRLITARSRRCLDESRLLLLASADREAVAAMAAGGRTAPAPQV